jgi:hypothetical protein
MGYSRRLQLTAAGVIEGTAQAVLFRFGYARKSSAARSRQTRPTRQTRQTFTTRTLSRAD